MRRPAAHPLVAGLLPVLLALFSIPLGADAARAAGSRHVVQDAKDFTAGELEGLALDSEGRLLPAPHQVHRWDVDAPYVWCLARDADGRLLAGSGDSGTVLRRDGDEMEVWAKTLAFEVLSLLPTADGVLAGTSPDGVVYRIAEDGSVEVALDLPQQSVWCLAPGSDGKSWLAGGGPGARVVRVGEDAPAGEVLCELPAANLMNMVRDGGGLWLATQGPGLLYRIQGDDRSAPRLVHESAEEEIRTMVSDGEGGVYLLALSTPGEKAKDQKVHSRVVHVTAAGAVEEIHAADLRYLSLARLADGGLLLGEAETGRLHRLDPGRGSLSLWCELDGGDPLALEVGDGEIAAATGNPGRIYLLRREERRPGTFTSAVVETPGNEAWGRLQVVGDGEDVQVATRSGVRAEPDATWSGWSGFHDPGAVPDAPVAPYLQYRLRIGTSARVSSVRLFWRERNLAPRITGVTVEDAGGILALGGINGGAPMPVSQRFDDGLAVEYSVSPPREQAAWDASAWARGLRTVRWKAEDPNGDDLRYSLEVRSEPDGRWYMLAEDLETPLQAWDTRAFPDGRYRLRVRADDGRDNAAEATRRAEALSDLVTVDNTPPRIDRWRFVDDDALEGRVSDEGSPLVDLSVRVGPGEWRPVDPEDGVVDGPTETLRLPRPAEAEAGARLWLRAVDAAGNVALVEITAP